MTKRRVRTIASGMSLLGALAFCAAATSASPSYTLIVGPRTQLKHLDSSIYPFSAVNAAVGDLNGDGAARVDAFQYSVQDNLGTTSNVATAGISVQPPPVATNDTADVQADKSDGGALNRSSIHIAANPAHGTATINNGAIVYTASKGYAGGDSFGYSVQDNLGAASNVATVTIDTSATTSVASKNGGGGAAGFLDLLALVVLIVFCPGNRWRRTGVCGSIYVLLMMFSAAASAVGTPHLVLDINTQRLPRSSVPIFLGKFGGLDYFVARTSPDGVGSALFKTDGTDTGTTKVKDIHGFGVLLPGGFQPTYRNTKQFVVVGSKAYFTPIEDATGQELWVTDGTEGGTHIVADTDPGPNGNATMLGSIGGDLIFASNTSDLIWQIFKTDGTSSGTVALTQFSDALSGLPDSYGAFSEAVEANSKIYVVLDRAFSCCQSDLWVSDGSAVGTHQIDDGQMPYLHLRPSSMVVVGNSIFMYGSKSGFGTGNVIDKLDTTTDTLLTLGNAQFSGGHAKAIAAMDGYIMFAGSDSQVWRSDGTVAGTQRVANIPSTSNYPGFLGSQDAVLTRVGNYAVFLGDDLQSGPGLWASDGSAAGTVRLMSTPADPPGFRAVLLGSVGTHAYYAVPSNSAYTIVVTDGTAAGTHLVSGIGQIPLTGTSSTVVSGSDSLTVIETVDAMSQAHVFAYFAQTNALIKLSDTPYDSYGSEPTFDGTRWFFVARDPVIGSEPWVTDGTPAGTHLVKNVLPEALTNDSDPNYFVEFGGRLAFVATDGLHDAAIYLSDGTAAGTVTLPKVGPDTGQLYPTNLTTLNGALYFFSLDPNLGYQFSRVASPGAAPQVLASLAPVDAPAPYYQNGCADGRATVLNGELYFPAYGNSGFGLYKTDGTVSGTIAIANSAGPYLGLNPCYLRTIGNRVFFLNNSAQLWSTDGTSSGAVQLSNGGLVDLPSPLTLNGPVYFSVQESSTATQLYRTDGTVAGTALAATFTSADGNSLLMYVAGSVNNKLLLGVTSGLTSTTQLWTSDGTLGGSTALITPPLNVAFPVTVVGSKAYFNVVTAHYGSEPWVTDGTQSGTYRLVASADRTSSGSSWFMSWNGSVVFEALDSSGKDQLFQTNGTSAGTKPLGEIGANPPSQSIPNIRLHAAAGQNLFWKAADSTAGSELFALANNDPPVAKPDTATSENAAAVTINVLGNDTDSDSSLDASSVKITTNPGHGTATVGTAGSITYAPTAGFSGQDSFAYTVADSQGAVSAPSQVTITVNQTVTVVGGSTTKSGGGGALGYADIATLLALAAGGLRRRRRPKRASC